MPTTADHEPTCLGASAGAAAVDRVELGSSETTVAPTTHEALLVVHRAAVGRMRARLDGAVAMTPDDPLACVDELLPTDAARLRDWAVWFACWSVALGDWELRQQQRAATRSVQATLRRVVRAAVAAGRLPAGSDVDGFTVRLIAALHGVAVHAVLDPQRCTTARLHAALRDRVGLDGLVVVPADVPAVTVR